MEDNMATQGIDLVGMEVWWKEDFKLTAVQKEEVENLITTKVWVTADRRRIPVKEMSTGHIQNCIKCWNGEGKMRIPPSYLGGKTKWLKIFNDELQTRN